VTISTPPGLRRDPSRSVLPPPILFAPVATVIVS
jgi:hypothetical protein